MNLLLVVAYAVALGPLLLAAGYVLLHVKWRDRAGKRSPIEKRPIPAPGSQLRLRIDALGEKFDEGVFALIIVGPFLTLAWLAPLVDPAKLHLRPFDAIWIAGLTGGLIWATQRIVRSGHKIRQARAGLSAELFTAHELNRLMASGCTVLHDIPAEGFNLDHVVIGPDAVFVVETKFVSKPRRNDGADNFKVQYDGTSLRFPDFTASSALEQARREASWLHHHLLKATNSAVRVVPTVALPGWFVVSPRDLSPDAVRVFSPAGKGAMFMADGRGRRAIDDKLQALITQALVMRYPASP